MKFFIKMLSNRINPIKREQIAMDFSIKLVDIREVIHRVITQELLEVIMLLQLLI